jgi:Ca2+-binding EF-hand superfamily protein
MEFYKMLSFIIEKDDVFKNIIFNEWNKALTTTSNNNNDKRGNDKYNYNYNENKNNDFKNNRNDDEYDDYDDYNIKKNDNYPNYIKLKKDLTKSPTSHIHNQNRNPNEERIETENTYNKVQLIPINKPIHQLKRNLSKDYSRHDQKKIIRQNSSQRQYSNININKSFDNNNPHSHNHQIKNNDKSPLEKLTLKLKMRGLRGLMNLHKQFLFTCSNNLSEISFSHFVTVLQNQKIALEKDEYKQIFLMFRKEHTKFLDFTKFIREFKRPLNERRLEAVEDAFAKLDVDSNDNIFIETIKRKYNPKGDPLLLKGVKNEEEVSIEFLDCFELNYNLLTAVDNQNVTNVVSFEEFANFYEYVSFLYDDDSQFVQLVNDSWDD